MSHGYYSQPIFALEITDLFHNLQDEFVHFGTFPQTKFEQGITLNLLVESQGFASGNAGLSNVKLKLSHQELATCREQDLSKSSWTRYCTLYLVLEQMPDSLSALVEESAALAASRTFGLLLLFY